MRHGEKSMYRIPQYILDKLKCSLCEGYLSVKPLVIRAEDQQICGKCFKLLPTVEKDKCVRQIGLETLAEVLIFPCRYKDWGCNFTFGWCDEKDHEKECTFRLGYLSVEDDHRKSNQSYQNYQNIWKNEFKAHSEDLNATFNYKINETSQVLAYKLRITGNSEKYCLTSGNSEEEVEISVEGTVSLQNTPQPIHTDLKLTPLFKDNVYESLNNIALVKKRCATCKAEIREDTHKCLLGHSCCESCKGKMCLVCVKAMERQSKRFCKNYEKGCLGVFSFDEIHDHESDCELNDVKCPLEPCNVIDALYKVKNHLERDHFNNLYSTSDVKRAFSTKDESFVILCYDGVFKCVYYYYKSFLEIFVTFIGSSKQAGKFTYEVSTESGGKLRKKRSKCSNWNNVMLEKGISFNREDVMDHQQKKFSLDARIRILQQSEN